MELRDKGLSVYILIELQCCAVSKCTVINCKYKFMYLGTIPRNYTFLILTIRYRSSCTGYLGTIFRYILDDTFLY